MAHQTATYKITKKDGMYELREYDKVWDDWWLKELAFTYWGIKRALYKHTHKKPGQTIGYFDKEGNQLYK